MLLGGWFHCPMSDSNLSPVAGSRVKSSATDLDSCGRKKSTGYPTEPTQGMERDMGVLCLVGWVFRSPPDCMSAAARPSFDPVPKRAMQMRVPWRPSVGVGTVEDAVWGLLGAKSPVEPPRRRAGQGCVGRRMPKSHPTSTAYVIASLGFLCDPPVGLGCPSPLFCCRDTRTGFEPEPSPPSMDSRIEKRGERHLGHGGLAQI